MHYHDVIGNVPSPGESILFEGYDYIKENSQSLCNGLVYTFGVHFIELYDGKFIKEVYFATFDIRAIMVAFQFIGKSLHKKIP